MRKIGLLFLLTGALALLCTNVAFASVGDEILVPAGTWVKPVPDDLGGNTARLDGGTDPWYDTVEINGRWFYRDPYWAANDKGFQYNMPLVPPELVQTGTGLDPGRIYEISVLYWNWAGGVSARMHGEAEYTQHNYGLNDGTNIYPSLPDNDSVYQAVIGEVQGVTSYQVDVRAYYAPNNSNDRWIGTAYEDIGAVPEPSSLVMIGMGLLCLFGICVRRRRIA